MRNRTTHLLVTALCGITAFGLAPKAAANLVQNGNFSQIGGVPSGPGASGMLGLNVFASDWTTSGYNFLYTPGTADTTGAIGNASPNPVLMAGPGNGSANGFNSAGPTGGNFVALAGAFLNQNSTTPLPITQSISGLTQGQTYTLSFFWAAIQQAGVAGATTEHLTASLGASSQTTGTVNIPHAGFSGWMEQTDTFVADGSTDVLSFLAGGTPLGDPPFVLLDDIDLEPGTPPVADTTSTVLLFGFGLAVMGFAPLSRRLCRN